jgi:hypothetical protein
MAMTPEERRLKKNARTRNYQKKRYAKDPEWRCRFLKEIGTTPFIQFNTNKDPSRRIKHLQRWANRRQIYWTCDIIDYIKRKDKQCTTYAGLILILK